MVRYKNHSLEEKAEVVEKYLFDSKISEIEKKANQRYENVIKKWKRDENVLNAISKKREIPLDVMKRLSEYRYTKFRNLPLSKVFDTLQMANQNISDVEIAKKLGISRRAVWRLREDETSTNLFEEVYKIGFRPKKRHPRGYWTRENMDKAYDDLKEEIRKNEDKERTPTVMEMYNKYPGFLNAIDKKRFGIESYAQYVLARGDKPCMIFYDEKTKEMAIKKYLFTEALEKDSGPRKRKSFFTQWIKNPKIAKYVFETMNVKQDDVLEERDFLDRGINEKKIKKFIDKMVSEKFLFKVGNDYTQSKELATELNQLYECLDGLKETSPQTAKRLKIISKEGIKSHSYNKDMAIKLRIAVKRLYETDNQSSKIERVTKTPIINGEPVLGLLNILHKTEDVKNAFEYESVMKKLDKRFIKAYADSAPFFSQYNLAKQLLRSELGGKK